MMAQRATKGTVSEFAWGSFPLAVLALAERPLMVAGIGAVLALVNWQLLGEAAEMSWGGFARGVLGGLIVAAVQTPLAVAVHRYVVLGERAGTAGDMRRRLAVYVRFFGWLLVFQVFGQATGAVQQALAPADPAQMEALPVVVGFAILAVSLVLYVRLAMLFPAVAVEAGDGTLGAAWANSARHFWKMLWSFLLVGLAMGAVLGVIAVGVFRTVEPHVVQVPAGPPAAVILAIVEVFLVALAAAMGSQFYLIWGRGLKTRAV